MLIHIIIVSIIGLTPSYLDDQPLVEKPVGDTGYYISIPGDYTIKESVDRPNFEVYYFVPSDSTVEITFSGGIYFGRYPNQFEPENDSCEVKHVDAPILGNTKSWTIFHCKDTHSAQVVTEIEGQWAYDFIHAFGKGISEAEMNKVLQIFSTLKRKEP